MGTAKPVEGLTGPHKEANDLYLRLRREGKTHAVAARAAAEVLARGGVDPFGPPPDIQKPAAPAPASKPERARRGIDDF